MKLERVGENLARLDQRCGWFKAWKIPGTRSLQMLLGLQHPMGSILVAWPALKFSFWETVDLVFSCKQASVTVVQD